MARVAHASLVAKIEQKISRRRHQDLADVVDLIRAHRLDRAFLKRLRPCYRRQFTSCLDEIKRDEEWERRQM
jgi:hypothetical protein